MEDFERFEESGSTGLAELAVDNPASTRAVVPGQSAAPPAPPLDGTTLAAVRSRVSTPALHAQADYYLTRRGFEDGLLRVKGTPCAECLARD